MKKSMLLLFIMSITLLGCSSDDDGYTDPPQQQVNNSVRITNNATFGDILIDAEGRSLYFFSKDTKDTSECSGGCLNSWPVFYSANLTFGAGLNASDFSTITRSDGAQQTVYKDWPLYYYAGDNASGDANGDGVGNVWYISKPDYSLMYVNAQLVGLDGNNYLSNYTLGDGETFYITNIEGRTMYTFTIDINNTNNYTLPDFSNNDAWPIVEISLDETPSILTDSDFGTIDVFGRTQLTYKGWPMYYFGQDTQRGDNKGISASSGFWRILNIETPLPPN